MKALVKADTARGRGAVLRLDAEVAGEVVLVVPGSGAERGRLGCGEDGGVAVGDAAQHPPMFVLGCVSAGHTAGCGRSRYSALAMIT